jgi:GT2 family glycosyltransferase
MVEKALSVIVPTRNEAHNVPAFLASLPPGVQLIVVDASQDATPELIQTLRPHNTLLLRYASTVTQGRQWGAEAAETTWLLFTDADVIFPPDYFERLRGYRGYDALYGPKLSTDEFRSYYRWFAQGQRLAHALGMPAASGSNLLVKRQVLKDIGGFDLELTCNEDSELAWRIKRRGYRVGFAPDLVVYARDHRRLHGGVARKTLHSWVRCALLYFNLMPSRWRKHDWGYWSLPRDSEELSKH